MDEKETNYFHYKDIYKIISKTFLKPISVFPQQVSHSFHKLQVKSVLNEKRARAIFIKIYIPSKQIQVSALLYFSFFIYVSQSAFRLHWPVPHNNPQPATKLYLQNFIFFITALS